MPSMVMLWALRWIRQNEETIAGRLCARAGFARAADSIWPDRPEFTARARGARGMNASRMLRRCVEAGLAWDGADISSKTCCWLYGLTEKGRAALHEAEESGKFLQDAERRLQALKKEAARQGPVFAREYGRCLEEVEKLRDELAAAKNCHRNFEEKNV